MSINRVGLESRIRTALRRSRVVVLTGPRQSGKTTLARTFADLRSPNYFDLESARDLERLAEAQTALEPLEGLIVIDEVQRRPELFPLLRYLADRPGEPAHFLVLGSASGELQRQSSESLAGRVERIDIGGFTLDEVGGTGLKKLWLRGGLPPSFTARTGTASAGWRLEYIRSLLERDLPQWGVRVPATALRRFWTMVAHYHGQIWNASEPARSLDVSAATVRRYLDLLTDALVLRQIHPWFVNVGKRQVKAPKVYVRDSGLLHALLGIDSEKALLSHPKSGASWEGFVVEQVLATEPHDDAWFWATHQGAEIDLVLRRGDKLFGVECKRVDGPRLTPSMKSALADVGLERIAVVYPGNVRYQIAERVEAVPLADLVTKGSLFGSKKK